MKSKFMVIAICLLGPWISFADEVWPKDVQTFVKNAAACEHAAGEFDDSLRETRQREIERAVVRYCAPAQRQLKHLKIKYKHDPKISEIVRQHANDSVISFR